MYSRQQQKLFLRAIIVLSLVLWLPFTAEAAVESGEEDRRGQVYFLRHALAPGTGDPPGMSLDDPASQRNLSEAGRRQAVKLGDALRQEGVVDAVVFTSEWERCRETAELLGFEEPIFNQGLNSFWERRETRGAVLKAFRQLIEQLPEAGPPVIFVTHYVNIQAVTGRAVGSGEGFWMCLNDLCQRLNED